MCSGHSFDCLSVINRENLQTLKRQQIFERQIGQTLRGPRL